jgi:hypothetical protein
MKSVLKGLTFAILTVCFGLASVPSASAYDVLTQPAVIDTGFNSCNTLCQPAVLAPCCPALAPVYGASSFWHRPLFLGGTPVNGAYLSPSVQPRANWYEGALFGHGWI